jgi:hypothetical protein
MSVKQRLQKQLESARSYSRKLLADFQTPEEWTRQVHANANHALWFAGHMAVSDNFFISNVAPERTLRRPEFEKAFGTGSQPTNNPSDYPPPQQVLDYMDERRATLLNVLDGLSDDALEKSLPKGTPNFLPDVGSVFETAVWHEGLHSGQLSVCRRSLGHRPVMETGS